MRVHGLHPGLAGRMGRRAHERPWRPGAVSVPIAEVTLEGGTIWGPLEITVDPVQPVFARWFLDAEGQPEIDDALLVPAVPREWDGRVLTARVWNGGDPEDVFQLGPVTITYPAPVKLGDPPALAAEVGDNPEPLDLRALVADGNPDNNLGASLTVTLHAGALAPGLVLADGVVTPVEGGLAAAVSGLTATFRLANSGGHVDLTWPQTVTDDTVDTTAPDVTLVSAGPPMQVDTDEGGTAIKLICLDAARTNEQVDAGTGTSAVRLTWAVGSGTTTYTVPADTVAYGTAWYHHLIVKDAAGNLSDVITTGPHTMGEAPPVEEYLTVTYLSELSSTSTAATVTDSGETIKGTDDDRHILIAVTCQGTSETVTGITVDGVAATRLAPGSNSYRSIWVAALTGANGATGDIAITRGGTLTRMIAHYYLVEGPLDITPVDTDTMYSTATTDPLTVSFTGLGSRVADGLLFALVSGTRVSGRDFTFSGDIATHSRRTSTGSASTEIQQISGFVVWDDTATGSVSLGGTKTGGTGSNEFYGAAVVLQRTA